MLRRACAGATTAFLFVLCGANPAAAHGGSSVPGRHFSAETVHTELFVCMTLFAILLLRFVKQKSSDATRRETRRSPSMLKANAGLVTLLATGTLIYLAARGPKADPFEIAPQTATLFILGLPVLTAIVGDIWPTIAPWRAVSKTAPKSGNPQPVVQAVGLLCFYLAWLRPSSGHGLAAVLALYLAVMAVVRFLKGIDVCHAIDPFSGVSVLFSRCSPFRHSKAPLPSVAYLPALVVLSATLFQALTYQSWWQQHHAQPTFVGQTLALLVMVFFVAAIAAVACGTSVYFSRQSFRRTMETLAPASVPLALGLLVTQNLVTFTTTLQNQLSVIWDPLDRGWRPVGAHQGITVDLTVPHIGAIQTIALLTGTVAAMSVTAAKVRASDSRKRAITAIPLFIGIGAVSYLASSLMAQV